MSCEIGAANAIIYKIQTTIDGGLRITLDLDASNHVLAAEIMKRKATGKEHVCVAFVEIPQ